MLSSSGVEKVYDYDAYGNQLSIETGDDNPFRYCGEYYDEETGLIYLRARYYSPDVGRFISADPAKDGINWYTYCADNPVAYVDRNGLWLDVVWDIFSLGMSIVDVCKNPTDIWAWVGLVGDAADVLIPCFGGIGEAVKSAKTVSKVADNVADVTKAANKLGDAVDAATDAAKAAKNGSKATKVTRKAAKKAAQETTGKVAKKAVGQRHHVLSNPIMEAINNHSNLKKYKNDFNRSKSVIRALTEDAHKGYQDWHRYIDHYITDLLGKNDDITPLRFWEEMRELYSDENVKWRFGDDLFDYINEMIKKYEVKLK